jgi:predicted phage terminase large subunit-like protein
MVTSARPKAIGPQPGPQEAFLATPADVAFYGGGAGSGKTFALLLDPLRGIGTNGFHGVIFRRSYPEIKQGGGLWDKSFDLYHAAGGEPNIQDLSWTFQTGNGGRAKIAFRHLQHETTVFAHQGGQYAFMGFDELTHFSARQFLYMLSRNRSTCGVRPWTRATLNPDPDSWVYSEFLKWYIADDGFPIEERAGMVRWWSRRDGRVTWHDDEASAGSDPMTFTFIRALIRDNPALVEADPGYLAKLDNLLPHERSRLLLGNWHARETSGSYFPRSAWRYINQAPDAAGSVTVRAWDRAATEPSPSNPDPDWTVGAKLRWTPSTGRFCILDIDRFRLGPGDARSRIVATAKADGPDTIQVLNQDPGAAGKTEVADLIRALAGSVAEAWHESGDKLTRARPLAVQAQAGNVDLLAGAAWVDDFVREVEQAGGPMGHDDQMDAASTAFNYITSGYTQSPGIS